MIVPDDVVQSAAQRFEDRAAERTGTELKISEFKTGAASVLDIDSPERVEMRRQRVGSQPAVDSLALAEQPQLLERIIGGSNLLAVAFLDLGTKVAGTVGRVHIRDQFQLRGFGTGFMVSPRLMMTNNHVLGDVASAQFSQLEFGFQGDVEGQPRLTHVFDLRPAELFLTNAELDVTVVAVSTGSRPVGSGASTDLADFGFNRLSGQQGKILLGESINIIQHPNGEPKQLALQDNDLVDRLETFLHYRGDTLPGSSGSPLFNNQWEVLGLHHSGVPELDAQGQILTQDGKIWDQSMGNDAIHWVANEGIRISSILTWLGERAGGLEAADLALLRQVLDAAPGPQEAARPVARADASPGSGTPTAPVARDAGALGPHHEASVTVPVTITVRIGVPEGAAAGPQPSSTDFVEAISIDPDYSTRDGYDADFLGLAVPLPALSAAQRQEAAVNTQPRQGRDDFVLDYHHYSVVVHRGRRLAWFTVVNIDGSSWRELPRETDRWIFDPRVGRELQLGPEVYAGNDFDRGHLVRRVDPSWGPDDHTAKVANDDTFHFTNCSPQHKDFNQGQTLWAGLENFVLAQATTDDKHITVFNGPVLLPDDPRYRGAQIPLAFWKVVVFRASTGEGSASAYLISQRELVEGELLEAAFVPRTFQVPVRSISEMTGLDFSHLHRWDPLDDLAPEAAPLDESVQLPGPGIQLGTYADLQL